MSSETVFRSIFLALFGAVSFVRGYFGWRMRRGGESSWALDEEDVAREGKWSILARLALFVYMLAAVALYAMHPPWMSALAMALPHWARWLGAGMGVAGLVLLVRVHATLGRQWSTNLHVREEHALITEGPYRWVRHPMYTALFTLFIGLGLVSANWLIIPLVAAGILVLAARIGKEEAMLLDEFGEAYRQYMGRTGRLLPRLIPRSG